MNQFEYQKSIHYLHCIALRLAVAFFSYFLDTFINRYTIIIIVIHITFELIKQLVHIHFKLSQTLSVTHTHTHIQLAI